MSDPEARDAMTTKPFAENDTAPECGKPSPTRLAGMKGLAQSLWVARRAIVQVEKQST